MGITRFATMPDGSTLAPLNAFKHHQTKLARAQRKLAKKKKGSQNWKTQKQLISRLHHKIADARKDLQHKASTMLSKNHAMIVPEDLKVRNMSVSAKGSQEIPGRNVRIKAGLNPTILGQGWFEFRQQLAYKQACQDGELVLVDPKYTSQQCPHCDHRHRDNRKTQANFTCVECGFTENVDVVGAMNVLARDTA
ncbi:transposase [Thalassomonas viridans]|uniref:Transposase n=1 Tax=Thalassomonas viridans TaxID=137584 RepID=A0AAE9ZCJ6_9GAMM|nr:transposase [Thalassomonas viridans]